MSHRTCIQRSLLSAASLLVLLLSVGCSAPAWVQGVVNDSDFAVTDAAPVSRVDTRNDEINVVISEEDADQLRLVTFTLCDASQLVVGKTYPIGTEEDGRTFLRVSQGDLDISYRSDGARIVSSVNNVFTGSVSGSVTIDSLDGVIAGTFSAELSDGGHVEGQFATSQAL